MNNQYLVPANTKRGQLIASIFRPIDLGIFVTGVLTTIIILIVVSNLASSNLLITILALLPALICTGLVVPVANYHNVLVAIQEIIHFYTNNRNYKWRGWCAVYESKRDEQ